MALNFEKFVLAETWGVSTHNIQVGTSLLGTEQIVATLADKWTAQVRVRVATGQVSAFRAWRTVRRGRLITDDFGPERDLAGGVLTVFHSDGTAHDDGEGYSQGYSVASAVALQATIMTVTDVGGAGNFEPGSFFGVAGRLYQITSLNAPVGLDVNFNFWPPLRSAMASGDGFDFPPRTDMRLQEDDSDEIQDDSTGSIDVTILLVEVP